MEINWDKQRMEFLKKHGWEVVDEGMINHPLFPLIEDISGMNSLSNFVEDFYGKAWETYKKMIEFYASSEESA